MIGLGTLLNSASIVAGGVAGRLAGKRFRPSQQESLARTIGVCVMFIAIAGAMEGMLRVDNGSLTAGRSMLVVLSLALGAAVGEVLNTEGLFLRLGEWLRDKTDSQGDAGFVNAFVTASLTVPIGAMAIMGSIQDGLLGDRVHPGCQIGAGFHRHHGDELFFGAGLRLFGHPGAGAGGRHDAPGPAHRPGDDRGRRGKPLPHRRDLGLLRGDQPGVGKAAQRGQYAARRGLCCAGGLSPLEPVTPSPSLHFLPCLPRETGLFSLPGKIFPPGRAADGPPQA